MLELNEIYFSETPKLGKQFQGGVRHHGEVLQQSDFETKR